MMTLAGRIRERLLSREIGERIRAYACEPPADECARLQLELFNAEWSRVLEESPFYSEVARHRRLPRCFTSWQEFQALLPITTRGFVQRNAEEIRCGPAEVFRVTGGTTAEPVQVPAWNAEFDHTHLDIWVGRSWYGIRPSSRLFLIWGHSHLLGRGARGWCRARQREVQDRLLGYHRYSAYDLRDEAMRDAAAEMLRFRPDYVMGYSVALDRFVRVNEALAPAIGELGVKVVIGAAEAFPSPDTRARLEELFRCPVAMEYGSVETNLVAHSAPQRGYRTFWRSYFVEAAPAESGRSGRKILVTSLYPRCVPLIRYEIGDEIIPDPGDASGLGVRRFTAVAGRCNDYVRLEDGAAIHSEAFTHAVRSFHQVKGYQIVQRDRDLAIRLLADEPLPQPVHDGIHANLARIHPLLAAIEVRRVPQLETTVAGKTPMVLRR